MGVLLRRAKIDIEDVGKVDKPIHKHDDTIRSVSYHETRNVTSSKRRSKSDNIIDTSSLAINFYQDPKFLFEMKLMNKPAIVRFFLRATRQYK